MRKLPIRCATRNLMGEPIILVKGETGYYNAPALDDESIDDYNRIMEADEEIINIMTCASMFGWDIPAVTNYEEGA